MTGHAQEPVTRRGHEETACDLLKDVEKHNVYEPNECDARVALALEACGHALLGLTQAVRSASDRLEASRRPPGSGTW